MAEPSPSGTRAGAFTDALRAEWLKLRTFRPTAVALGATLLVMAALALLAWYVTGVYDHLPAARRAHMAMSDLSDLTEWAASLFLGILGVLALSTEYSTGMLRVTLTAIPRRHHVLAAKAATVGALSLLTGQAATLGTALLTRLILAGRPIQGQPTGTLAHQLPTLLAQGLSVPMFALLGLGLAALTRSAVAAIATLAAIWYVIPPILADLPAPWSTHVSAALPGALPGELAGTGNHHSIYGGTLSPTAASALMLAWSLLPLLAAALLVTHRDTR